MEIDGRIEGRTARRPVGHAHRPLRHAVLEDIRRRIVDGEWRQGERLFEDQIASELDVSRNPVREALQALAGEGFVVLEPRRGARVATVSRARAVQLFEVREALEGLVARLAADKRSEHQLEEMQIIANAGRAAVERRDHALLPTLNSTFHHCLGAAAANEILSETIDRLRHVIQWVYARSIVERAEESWTEHSAIVGAIARRDGADAERLARAHISEARAAYLEATID